MTRPHTTDIAPGDIFEFWGLNSGDDCAAWLQGNSTNKPVVLVVDAILLDGSVCLIIDGPSIHKAKEFGITRSRDVQIRISDMMEMIKQDILQLRKGA